MQFRYGFLSLMIILFSFSVALGRLSCLGSSKHSCCSRNPFSSQPFSNSLGCYSWEDVPVWKVLGSGRKLWSGALGQRAMTWKCPLEEQHADVLLFQRVSSTGTVSCLYPLSYTSLLSLVNRDISLAPPGGFEFSVSEVLVIWAVLSLLTSPLPLANCVFVL